jgi:hypothetical protein
MIDKKIILQMFTIRTFFAQKNIAHNEYNFRVLIL